MNFWRLCHMEHTLMPWEKVGPQFKKFYKRAGMLVDLDRCIGCHSCSVSCKTENDVPLGNFRIRVRYLEQPDQSAFRSAMAMPAPSGPIIKFPSTLILPRTATFSLPSSGTFTPKAAPVIGNMPRRSFTPTLFSCIPRLAKLSV